MGRLFCRTHAHTLIQPFLYETRQERYFSLDYLNRFFSVDVDLPPYWLCNTVDIKPARLLGFPLS